MNSETPILCLERTNTRDGINYVLLTDEAGTPKCPHCGALMGRCGDMFENHHCRCWWHGSDKADYQLQVVIFAEEAGQFHYDERRAEEAREIAVKRADAKVAADARRAALVGKKAFTKIIFEDHGYGMGPRRGAEEIEVEILKAYVKDFDVFQGGAAEVFDVKYPDGRVFFIRAKQARLA